MAALGGFVSKVGLATGPLVGALLIIEYGFGLIINIASIALALAVLFIYISSTKHKESTE